jgi:hypothetical protein
MDESPQTLFQAAFPVSVFSTAMLILILAYLAWIEVALRNVECDPPFGPVHYGAGRPKHKPGASVQMDKQPATTSVIEK